MDDLAKLHRLSSFDTVTYRDKDGQEVTAMLEGFRSIPFAGKLEPHAIVQGSQGGERSVPMHRIIRRERPGCAPLDFEI